MQSLEPTYKAHRQQFFIAAAFTLAYAVAHFLFYRELGKTMLFFAGLLSTNLIFWVCRDFFAYRKVREADRDRKEWEQSMLTVMQLAQAATQYSEYDNPSILSAYHDLVTERQSEGFAKGYLNKGHL